MNQPIRLARQFSPIGKSIRLAGARLGNPDTFLSDSQASAVRQGAQTLLQAIGALGNPASLSSWKNWLETFSYRLQQPPVYVADDYTSTLQGASDAIAAENAKQGGQVPTMFLYAEEAAPWSEAAKAILAEMGNIGNPASLAQHRSNLESLVSQFSDVKQDTTGRNYVVVRSDYGQRIENARAATQQAKASPTASTGPSTVEVAGVIGVIGLGLWLALG